MKRSKNKVIMIVLTAAIISNTAAPISAMAKTYAMTESYSENSGKEEVIYINLNGNGSVGSAYAVNIFNSSQIKDYGDYSSIRNMNTTDELIFNNGEVTGTNSVDKLYYQGTLKEVAIPWDIKIKYYLDRTEISAEDIAGKSGSLEIKISITENEKCNNTFFENYALQSTVVLDTAKCTNIESEGATIANVGSNKQLSYIILPDKGKEISIKADVNDFEMESIAINGVKLNLNVDVDSDELVDKVKELTDAIDKLNLGAGKINAGTSELNSKTTDLTSGISAIGTGSISLNRGILKVQEALETLNQQSETLTAGSRQVLDALNTIASALNNVKLSSESINSLISASSEIQDGIDSLVLGITSVEASTNYTAYKNIMNENGLDIDSLKYNNSAAIESINSQITSLTIVKNNLLASGIPETDSQIVTIQSQIDQFMQISILLQGNNAAISGTEYYFSNVSSGISSLLSGAETLKSKYTEFDVAINKLSNVLSDMIYNMSALSSTINTLITEYDALDTGINSYTEGVTSLLEGYYQIVSGSTSLVEGTSTLKEGTDKLTSGVSELYSGTAELSQGTAELNDKTTDLDIEVTDKIDEMVDDLCGTSEEIVSFISQNNTNIKSVQFVIKTPSIENKKVETIKEEEETLSLLERIINLFK